MDFTFQTGIPKPYIQIDLGSNMNISYVEISHGYENGNSMIDTYSLLDTAYLIIYADNIEDTDDEAGIITYI